MNSKDTRFLSIDKITTSSPLVRNKEAKKHRRWSTRHFKNGGCLSLDRNDTFTTIFMQFHSLGTVLFFVRASQLSPKLAWNVNKRVDTMVVTMFMITTPKAEIPRKFLFYFYGICQKLNFFLNLNNKYLYWYIQLCGYYVCFILYYRYLHVPESNYLILPI